MYNVILQDGAVYDPCQSLTLSYFQMFLLLYPFLSWISPGTSAIIHAPTHVIQGRDNPKGKGFSFYDLICAKHLNFSAVERFLVCVPFLKNKTPSFIFPYKWLEAVSYQVKYLLKQLSLQTHHIRSTQSGHDPCLRPHPHLSVNSFLS